ncbi:glycosyltransferase [Thermoleptolyngbya sp. M55_K2018_002]|uniref:glycosyltransferase family protein n=1 Tax=Thermoleptolyngbya sp. M55_K2018_002 TaxID=2747808 RepID=UPI0019F665A2|nr:glycosyltransferase [Thermoleptolyngbya sp. M55_K2018_002]HIK39064.1 glycosyltransferase [Thermoleptolyngbya sp. M55_K2018_002]
MKLAIQNPFFDKPYIAEVEMSRRLALAAENIGWQAVEVQTAAEIRAAQPDCVIVLHHWTPKVAPVPTYLCMWSPPEFFEGTDRLITNTLSYDGYLIGSRVVDRWLHHLLCHTPKRYFKSPFYTSAPKTAYRPPDLSQPRLVYLGSNWDGPRFKQLFEGLDQQPYMDVYGNPDGWTYLNQTHRGALPYDGNSVFEAIHSAGVGLCLHREEHRQAEMPSMRIFEIAAAGAVAICSDHAFIREAFGDTVLYIDADADPAEQVEQISQHMAWIAQHPQQAEALAAAAHEIFIQHYTLEKHLLDLLPHHEALLTDKGFKGFVPAPMSAQPPAQVQVIVRVGGRPLSYIRRALDSLAAQTYPNIGVILVEYQPVLGLDEAFLGHYGDRLQFRRLASPAPCRSTTLWTGLRAVDAPYFAILDDDDAIHPNHLHTLVKILEQQSNIGVAYSGTLKVLESGSPETLHQMDTITLPYFQPFRLQDLLELRNFMPPNSYVVRRQLLQDILDRDPLLDLGEDFCLVLMLCQRAEFCFSYEATAEVYWRSDTQDNASYSGKVAWRDAMRRLRLMFWKQEFAPGQTLLSLQELRDRERQASQPEAIQHLEAELGRARGRIAAMETSKFWQLRDRWFRLKRRLGLPVEE